MNFLNGGKFGDCPPYFLNYTNNLDENLFENVNYDDSDFTRLYYTIVSYIPFDCIQKTKKFYQKFKKTMSEERDETSDTQWNYSYLVYLY